VGQRDTAFAKQPSTHLDLHQGLLPGVASALFGGEAAGMAVEAEAELEAVLS